MTTAEALRAAAARVRQGWCQNAMRDMHGNVCALGALSAVDVPLIQYFYSAMALADALGLNSQWDGAIPDWNDAPGQTGENVAQGMELAALIWEQKQAHVEAHVQHVSTNVQTKQPQTNTVARPA